MHTSAHQEKKGTRDPQLEQWLRGRAPEAELDLSWPPTKKQWNTLLATLREVASHTQAHVPDKGANSIPNRLLAILQREQAVSPSRLANRFHKWAELPPEAQAEVVEDLQRAGALTIWVSTSAKNRGETIYLCTEAIRQCREAVLQALRKRTSLPHDPETFPKWEHRVYEQAVAELATEGLLELKSGPQGARLCCLN